jgi:glycosyltransferase involved in cell wall biosynthesis
LSSLRIILVMLEPPLPFGNPAARWYYALLKGLVARGHRVTTLVSCSDLGDAWQARRLFPDAHYDIHYYPTCDQRGWRAAMRTLRRPYSYLFNDDLRQDLAALLRAPYDVLHLEHLWSGYLGFGHEHKSLINVHYLFSIDLADLAHQNLRDRVRWLRTCQVERRLLRRFPTLSALSDRLADRIRGVNPRGQVHTLPLAMDLSLYPFQAPTGNNGHPVLGLIGSYTWEPTFSAAERLIRDLWPRIKRQVPGARLQLVGRQARARLAPLLSGVSPDISVHENVPDTFPYFAQTDVMLYAPRQGSGMKVKVMEAFALGTPVVTTADGVEGLHAIDGVQAAVADDDNGLVERAVVLLRDASQRQRIRQAARQLIERQCSPEPVLDRLEQIYARIASPPA